MNFNASIFVIPNHQTAVTAEELACPANGWNRRLAIFGFPQIEAGDAVVQIWSTSPEQDSWNNHGAPEELIAAAGIETHGRPGYFPEVWPAKLFKNLKEGETITIEGKGFTITFKAEQLKYRYRSFGKFEEVLAKVTSK